MANDNISFSQVLFEINICICDRFTSLNPFEVRKQRFKDVFCLIKKLTIYNKRHKKNKNGKRIIRKPASDNWF